MTDWSNRVTRQLDDLRQQEQALTEQVQRLTEQLLMTRGAIQILERILNDPPPETENKEKP